MIYRGREIHMNEALAFIKSFQAARGGVSPTCQEIATALGLKSKGYIHNVLLRGLEDRGLIRRIPRRARAIEVIRPRYQAFKFDADLKELRPN